MSKVNVDSFCVLVGPLGFVSGGLPPPGSSLLALAASLLQSLGIGFFVVVVFGFFFSSFNLFFLFIYLIPPYLFISVT